tara:strand:+ start:8208 stop:8450 length:243 start_codon:yes stop_codon:yes gene_type:complete
LAQLASPALPNTAWQACQPNTKGRSPVQDEAQEGPDSNALLSNQLSVVENSLSRNETEANENRRLPEVETAEFLGGSGGT